MMMIMQVTFVYLLGILLVATGIDDDWTAHCDKCKCMWKGGRKLADCKSLSLSDIPTMLSSEVREVDFSLNPLYELKAREFSAANLSDIHKMKFQNCSLGDINYTAFDGLSLLIELDLSHNNINKLSPKVFHSNTRLRIINLAHNNIAKLEPGLFVNMTHLQRTLLNNNALQYISSDVFGPNCTLQHIDVSYNNLRTVDANFLDSFPKITSLTLQGNPWVCDCNLEKFRSVSLMKNLITTNTLCEEPERLRGELWSDNKIVFACVPEILELVSNAQGTSTEISTNYTMSCKVKGSPDPDINWTSNGRIIDRDPRQSVQKYVTTKNQIGDVIWNNLTIISTNHRDRGEYKCVAKNPGGSAEANITLTLRAGGDGDGGIYVMSSSSPLAWIIGLSVGALVLLVVIFVLIYCCCKRNGRDNNIMSKSRRLSQSNEFISLDGHPDMGKSLITEVNPVVKPPRQYSVPQSVTSGGTEVSETKKMLIDDDSIYDDESRSIDFESRYPPKIPNHRIEYRGESHYPPDLLSFPPHAIPQVSPAGSSASTVADTSRLPAHHGHQSPLHSPLYDNIYRTLPYSRSHSPFTSPHGGLTVRVPRQGGYVTIPRRPRQSWSSEPPPSSETGEPLYDNLGLRTTATGSSVLSLNKIGTDNATPKASTPKGNGRPPYPLSPNLVSLPCDPIAEQESPPIAATLPRSASAHRALSPTADLLRANWTRSPEPVDSRRESTASLLPTPDGKTPKIPPRPPPKPKKRASTGPLFEDEGEDGTEV